MAAQHWAAGKDWKTGVFEVWPEHWETVEVFMATVSQWRVVAGLGSLTYLGLDYQALPAVLKLMGIKKKNHQRIFWGLQEMERAARPLLNATKETKPARRKK
ncbi:DUF1799 domain-containing protein [Methylobacillus flagellatus]|uniref:Uncharacterized protein n=1 Tax=Methylobacillus flagellatus (strain ATCC 51484 / DSM 6875 / VKM B-1610 / KT) TaxID=265072 RepID=Q1GXT4_METFK|nr:DUF1799 domain-containing protein [Methylobacillus flagellatus]ABE50953.1 hypothetical protein Mfla_2690 [Methylobacillus flagellatus KT]